MLRTDCPHCGQRVNAPEQLAGKSRPCPRCRGSIIVPTPRAEHCHGCAAPLRVRLNCASCKRVFCSETCLLRHAERFHGLAPPEPATPTNPWHAIGWIVLSLLIASVVVIFAVCGGVGRILVR